MNKENFTSYLENPSKLYQLSYQELKTLVLQYPYCQNLHLLLLKKSMMEGNGEQEDNLQTAAVYSLDRAFLFQQLKHIEQRKKAEDNVILQDDFLELKDLSSLSQETQKELVEISLEDEVVESEQVQMRFDLPQETDVSNEEDFLEGLEDSLQVQQPLQEDSNLIDHLLQEMEVEQENEKTEISDEILVDDNTIEWSIGEETLENVAENLEPDQVNQQENDFEKNLLGEEVAENNYEEGAEEEMKIIESLFEDSQSVDLEQLIDLEEEDIGEMAAEMEEAIPFPNEATEDTGTLTNVEDETTAEVVQPEPYKADSAMLMDIAAVDFALEQMETKKREIKELEETTLSMEGIYESELIDTLERYEDDTDEPVDTLERYVPDDLEEEEANVLEGIEEIYSEDPSSLREEKEEIVSEMKDMISTTSEGINTVEDDSWIDEAMNDFVMDEEVFEDVEVLEQENQLGLDEVDLEPISEEIINEIVEEYVEKEDQPEAISDSFVEEELLDDLDEIFKVTPENVADTTDAAGITKGKSDVSYPVKDTSEENMTVNTFMADDLIIQNEEEDDDDDLWDILNSSGQEAEAHQDLIFEEIILEEEENRMASNEDKMFEKAKEEAFVQEAKETVLENYKIFQQKDSLEEEKPQVVEEDIQAKLPKPMPKAVFSSWKKLDWKGRTKANIKAKEKAEAKGKKKKKKKKAKNPVVAFANQSLEDKNNVATETMARILTMQKKYDDAIEMYEQLILIFPKKSAYFAEKIENIKNNLK